MCDLFQSCRRLKAGTMIFTLTRKLNDYDEEADAEARSQYDLPTDDNGELETYPIDDHSVRDSVIASQHMHLYKPNKIFKHFELLTTGIYEMSWANASIHVQRKLTPPYFPPPSSSPPDTNSSEPMYHSTNASDVDEPILRKELLARDRVFIELDKVLPPVPKEWCARERERHEAQRQLASSSST
jgi:hypothetical protein